MDPMFQILRQLATQQADMERGISLAVYSVIPGMFEDLAEELTSAKAGDEVEKIAKRLRAQAAEL